MKKFSPSYLKFLRSSDILYYANVNTDEIIGSLRKLLGNIYYHYFVDQSINNVFHFDVKTVGNDKFLSVSIDNNQEFTFIDQNGLSVSKNNELATYSLIYDENTPLNGSQSNPINIPISILDFDNVPLYSRGLFSYIYVNGHPQTTTEYNILQDNNNIYVYFNRIKQGKIAPLPKNKEGKFNKDIVNEIFWSDFKNEFCVNSDPSQCYIEFPLLNLPASNKDLVLEVKLYINNWLNVFYYHVPKDFPVYNSQIFYKVSEDSPNKILINLSSLPLDDQDKLSFYFLEKLPSKKFDSSNITVSQYYLPVQNISSETYNYIKVLSLNPVTGMFTNLIELNDTLFTKVVDVQLNGTLNINSSFLYSPDAPVYAYDYILTPPLPIYISLDMPNNVTIAGKLGGSINIPNTNDQKSYKLYVKNIEVPEFGQTFYNSLSNKTSQVSIKNIRPYFLIAESTQTVDNSFMLLGDISVNGTTFDSFTPNYQLNINDLTQILTSFNNINTDLTNLKTEVYGSSYLPSSNRPPILQRLDNLEVGLVAVQQNINSLNSTVSSLNIADIQDQINILYSYADSFKDFIKFSDTSLKTNNKGVFILNKDIINTFLNNTTSNIINLFYILQYLGARKVDFYVIPIGYKDLLSYSSNIVQFLKILKELYIANIDKNLPKPVLLIIFNNNIHNNLVILSNFSNLLSTTKLKHFINIGLQIEKTYTTLNNNVISFNEISSYILDAISLLDEKLFIFSYDLQNLQGLLPKDIVNNSIIMTSSRYIWKKSINSKEFDLSKYYSINVIDDLFDLSVFCTPTNKIALCDLIPTNAYSDLSFLDFSLDTSGTYPVYNNPYDVLNAYLKAKHFNVIEVLGNDNVDMFVYNVSTSSPQWSFSISSTTRGIFLDLYPKIPLYSIDISNNELTNNELPTYQTNDLMYRQYILSPGSVGGNIFEVSSNLMFIFNNVDFNASLNVNGVLDDLSSYTNLLNISLSSGTLTVEDANDSTNNVTYSLPNTPLHLLYLQFSFDPANNTLFVNIYFNNSVSYLTLQNISYPISSMFFNILNSDSTNDLIISKLYV